MKEISKETEDILYGMTKSALCLYCHYIIFSDANKETAEKYLARNVNKEVAKFTRNEFENKLMQTLIQKNEIIKALPKRLRRIGCAVYVTIKLDKPNKVNEDALWRMVDIAL